MYGTQNVDNSQDMLYSLDIEARIAELEALKSEDPDSFNDYDDQDELDALYKLKEEAEGYARDWEYGEYLIRDSYFEEYAEQLADDIGAIDQTAGWPLTYIDWERAAEALQQDYTAVDYGGVIYWVR